MNNNARICEAWIAMPRPLGGLDLNSLKTALPMLLRSPSRNWGSRNWEAELERGTFNQMDGERRDTLDFIFKSANIVEVMQDEIYTLQGRLKALAVSTTVGQSDRLRYYEMIGIDLPLEHRKELFELMAQDNERGAAMLCR
jgi:hypothetical protein